MVASLPQLKQLDGIQIENSERIIALQVSNCILYSLCQMQISQFAEEEGGGRDGGEGGGEAQDGETEAEAGA